MGLGKMCEYYKKLIIQSLFLIHCLICDENKFTLLGGAFLLNPDL